MILAALAYEPAFLKITVIVDEDIDVHDYFQLLWAMSWHVQPERDIYIYKNTVPTTLDPSLAPEHTTQGGGAPLLGSKVGIDATRKHAFPARSIPPSEDLARVDAQWEDYGFE